MKNLTFACVAPSRVDPSDDLGTASYHIEPGAVTAFSLTPRETLTVSVEMGDVWVTKENCRHDLVLASGQSRLLQGPGKVVLTALTVARGTTLKAA